MLINELSDWARSHGGDAALEARDTWNEDSIEEVWNKLEDFGGMEGTRRDPFGRFIHRLDYQNYDSSFGWAISHICPLSDGGDDSPGNLLPLNIASLDFKGDLSLDEALAEWDEAMQELAEVVLSPLGEVEVRSILRSCDYYMGSSEAYGELLCAIPQGREENLDTDELKGYELRLMSVRETVEILTREKVRFYTLRLYL